MQYSLGPILYYWDQSRIATFYDKAANSEVDIIYLGETVCTKRRELKYQDWFNLARELSQSGKQIVLSTLALLEAPSELRELQKYIDNGDFLIEANDLAAIQLASEAKIPFVVGHAINCYNAQTLKILLKKGMVRWCMPVELSKDWLVNILLACDDLNISGQFEVEVFAYGHMPLAYSARCFTARSENRSKEQCETCCIQYPNGKQVYSQDNHPLFVLNGIQTQSGACYHLGNHQKSMLDIVDIVRLSPNDEHTLNTLAEFKANLHGHMPMRNLENTCNGYWLNVEGMQIG